VCKVTRGSAKANMRTTTTPELAQLTGAKTAAKETGIPYTTLRDLAFRGEIPVVRLGRAWYFDRRDLARFIAGAKETLGEAGGR
jgi:excisionase family DNA binding protein